jgi:hypothetical protein
LSRGLSTGSITNLAQSEFVTEVLVEITLSNGSQLFYTTGHSNVTTSTPTRPVSTTYNATNQVTVVSSLRESYDPLQGDFILQIDTTDTSLINSLTTNFLKITVVAYKMFRNISSNVPDTTNLIQLYNSNVTDCVVQGGLDELSIQLRSRTILNGLDVVKGRTNSQLEPSTGINIVWGSIQWRQQ